MTNYLFFPHYWANIYRLDAATLKATGCLLQLRADDVFWEWKGGESDREKQNKSIPEF